MEIINKRFEELSVFELYEILKLRSDIFVVEQNCVYPDLDDKDYHSNHIYLKSNDKIVAYLRVIDKGISFESVAIGRVLALERRKGYASKLLKYACDYVFNVLKENEITIEAQVYARKLYEGVGFKQTSDVFLEDGIEHIQMKLFK